MPDQKQLTITHIESNIKQVHKAENELVKERRIFKTIGVLSLAKELEIISTKEYEEYYNKIFI